MQSILNFFKQKSKYEATSIEDVQFKLKKYGICYVPNALTDDECVQMISGTWDFIEHLTQNDDNAIKRHDPNTWINLSSLRPGNDMLYHFWNVGHSQHLWDIRQNPKILKIFSMIWDCEPEDLLVSFDGMAFLPPPEVTSVGFMGPKSKYYHLDQSLERPYFDGIQGFVTAYDINEGDATLSFYESSHKQISNFIEEFGIIHTNDWCPFNPMEIDFFAQHCIEVQMKCPAGSLVLWDSRIVHTPVKPLPDRSKENTRCIAYLSYSKKDRISDEKLELKIKAFENMYTTNHYAHNPTLFPEVPDNHSNIKDYVTQIEFPTLSKIGYSLVGYSNEEINKFMPEESENTT